MKHFVNRLTIHLVGMGDGSKQNNKAQTTLTKSKSIGCMYSRFGRQGNSGIQFVNAMRPPGAYQHPTKNWANNGAEQEACFGVPRDCCCKVQAEKTQLKICRVAISRVFFVKFLLLKGNAGNKDCKVPSLWPILNQPGSCFGVACRAAGFQELFSWMIIMNFPAAI